MSQSLSQHLVSGYRTGRSWFLLRLWLQFETWQERSRQRYALAQMNEHALKDIGLSYGEVMREVRKPFWRA